MRKLCGLAGGSTKGIFHLGLTEKLKEEGVTFDVIAGVSIGGVLGIPTAMGLEKEAAEVFINIGDITNFFDRSPVTSDGKIKPLTTAFSILCGKNGIGKQNIEKAILPVVNEKVFNEYKHGNYPPVYVLYVNGRTKAIKITNLKTVTYPIYVKVISASACIPIMCEPVYILDKKTGRTDGFIDGGVRKHNPSARMLRTMGDIGECYSSYTRPKNLTNENPNWDDNLLTVTESTFEAMNIELSKKDELDEIEICEKKGIKLHQYFAPRILTSLYDTDPTRLEMLYNAGRNAV